MSSFPLRRPAAPERGLRQLAEVVGAEPPAVDVVVRGIAPLAHASANQIGFLADRRYLGGLAASPAAALLVGEALLSHLGEDERPRLVVRDPHRALADLLEHLHPELPAEPEVHPTAVLGRGVRLGEGVRIAPYAVLEEGCEIGDRVRIGAHAVLGSGVRVGPDARIHPHVVLYPGVQVGARAVLHAGARVGVDGFGYVHHGGAHHPVPQIGACILEDDVDLGANTTVDRGSIGETRVRAGAKLDNLVHLGHNVVIGPLSVLAAQVGIAGSTRLEAGVQVGGQAGLAGHILVGEGARLAGQAGVTGNVSAGETVMGFPARPRSAFLRAVAAQGRLQEILHRLGALERRLESADEASPASEDHA